MAKTSKPKITDLCAIYKKVAAVAITTRIIALFEALDWWDRMIAFRLHKDGAFNSEQSNIFRRANLARKLAVGTSVDEEKFTAVYQTLRQYERLFQDSSIPSVETAINNYESKRVALQARQDRMEKKFVGVLEVLNTAFQNFGIVFGVAESDKAHRFDGNKTLLLNPNRADQLRSILKTHGPLAVLFEEAVPVLRASGVERDASGTASLNMQRIVSNLPQVFESVRNSCTVWLQETTASKLMRFALPASAETQTAPAGSSSKPSARVKRGRATGPKIAGCFTPGSAQAEYFKLLGDGCRHTYEELQAVFYVKLPKDTVWYIWKRGQQNGRWTVHKDKDGARMEVHDPTVWN